ncbi:MAG: hypothetical protein KAY24_14345, partial [Candidatus Eisenbacteria sp.]|nr:hypothetical protein [Candidatus Eisenbacteria bacterium]
RTEHQFGTLESIAALPGALLDLLTYPNEPGRQFQNVIISQCDHTNAAAIEARRLKAKPHSATVRRRAVYAGYTLDHQELIFTALNALGRRPEEFLALGIPGLSSFWPRVSSLDIDCELTLYRDRQWERPVCPNDVRDIGHLALAVPYCDIVVTENFWARALEETGLAKKYGTIACADLTGLLEQYKAE